MLIKFQRKREKNYYKFYKTSLNVEEAILVQSVYEITVTQISPDLTKTKHSLWT